MCKTNKCGKKPCICEFLDKLNQLESDLLNMGFKTTNVEFDDQTNTLTVSFVDGSIREVVIPDNVNEYELTDLVNNSFSLLENGQIKDTIDLTPYVNLPETITSLELQGNNLVYTKEDSTQDVIDLSFLIDVQAEYTLTPISGTNQFSLLKDGIIVSTLDLSSFLDNTNLPRVISGFLNSGTIVFTRDDNSTFVVDISGLVPTESEYTLSPITGSNQFSLLKDGNIVTTLDLTPYLDDTNLSRIVEGTVDALGIATFERDDLTTFTVDFSTFFDNTNLPRIISGNYDNVTKNLTLTRDDASTVIIDLSTLVSATLPSITNTLPSGNLIGVFDDGTGSTVNINETVTTMTSGTDINKLSYTDENNTNVEVEVQYLESLTMSEILSKRTASELVVGAVYLINDYRTKYTQFYTGIDSNSAQGITDGLQSVIEPLYVIPIASNDIGNKFFSYVFRDEYLILNLFTDGGTVTRRVNTTNKFKADFDYRAEKFRFYKTSLREFDSNLTYNRGDVVQSTGNVNPADDGVYINILDSQFTGEGDPLDLQNTKIWMKSPTMFSTGVGGMLNFNNGYLIGSSTEIFNLQVDTNDYIDVYALNNSRLTTTAFDNSSIIRGIVIGGLISNSSFVQRSFSSDTLTNPVYIFRASNSNMNVSNENILGYVSNFNGKLEFKNIFYRLRGSNEGFGYILSSGLFGNVLQSNIIYDLELYTSVRVFNDNLVSNRITLKGSPIESIIRISSDTQTSPNLIDIHDNIISLKVLGVSLYVHFYQKVDTVLIQGDTVTDGLRDCTFYNTLEQVNISLLNSGNASYDEVENITFNTPYMFDSNMDLTPIISTEPFRTITHFFRDGGTKDLTLFYQTSDNLGNLTSVAY